MNRNFFRLLLSAVLMMCCVSVWAETVTGVKYIDDKGVEQTLGYPATVVDNSTTTLDAGWYIVTGELSTRTLTCNGDVHLILADGAKLTAQGWNSSPGVHVPGGRSRLTIYGQTNQTGELTATGGEYCAGIGGGNYGFGSDITINGGTVNATGGEQGAGIGGGNYGFGSHITINGGTVNATGGDGGAGIGGGQGSAPSVGMDDGGETGSGYNILIFGGTVNATGGDYGAGIGGGCNANGSNISIYGGTVTASGGDDASAIGGGDGRNIGSNIVVDADCRVLAGDNSTSTSEIKHNSDTDLASDLSKHYAFIEIDQTLLKELQCEAISAIDEAIIGVTDAYILGIASKAKNDIPNATSRKAITSKKDAALAELENLIKGFDLGKAEILGEMGTECDDCPAVRVTKGDKEVVLYAPDEVEMIKVHANE